jgi:hypothetical protein
MTALLEPTETPAPAPPAVTPPVTTPPGVASGAGPAPGRRDRPALSDRAVRLFGLRILALVVLGAYVQPAADGPDPSRPLWASALDVVTTVGLLGLVVGTVAARRWTPWAGLLTGVPMFALSVSCPLSGHHQYAAWWGVQLAAFAAMIALSAVTLRRTRG